MPTERLTFEGGLATQTERTASPPNTLRELVNWVPEPAGGLRARTAWTGASSETGAPATKEPLGALLLPAGGLDSAGILYVANAGSSTSITLYRMDMATGFVPMTGYTVGDTVSGLTAPVQDHPVHFSDAGGIGLYIHPGMTALRSTNGVLPGSPPSGSCVAWYENRIFVGGQPGADRRVLYSAIGGATWGASDWFDTSDLTRVVCLLPTQYGLLIGKLGSLELLRGSGPDTFQRIVLDGGNCGRGHSMVSTPYGVVILGTRDAFLWDGGSVHHIDRLVDTARVGAWWSASYRKGKDYIADGAGTTRKMWVLDLETQPFSWSQEYVAADGSSSPQVLHGVMPGIGDQLLGFTGGGVFGNRTASRWGIHRLVEGTRAIDSLVTSAETFTARTQGFFLGSARSPATVRYLYLQIKQRGAAGTQGFNVTPYADNVAQTTQPLDRATGGVASSTGTALGDSVYRLRVDLGFTAYEVSFLFSHAATGAPIFDIESAIVEYDVEEAR